MRLIIARSVVRAHSGPPNSDFAVGFGSLNEFRLSNLASNGAGRSRLLSVLPKQVFGEKDEERKKWVLARRPEREL